MAYDQYSGYAPGPRPYYNQPPPPRNASRGAPPPQQPRGMNGMNGMGGMGGYGGAPQDRYQQPQNARVESYVGYDDSDILDQYGTDDHDQQSYQQPYGQQPSYNGYGGGQYDARPPPQRAPPQQYREPPQRRDNYGPAPGPGPQGYGGRGGMGGQMEGRGMAGPGGRGRGPPPRGYPPPQRGGYPPEQGGFGMRRAQTAPQDYDDAAQYSYDIQSGPSPPQQKRE